MLCTRLDIPEWLGKGIKPNHRGGRIDKYIYGGDTETVRGRPNSLQFYSEDIACEDIYFVNEGNASRVFLRWCERRRFNALHVVYVHNLAFDLVEFLWGSHAHLVSDGGDFSFSVGDWRVSGVYGAPTFCRISNGHNRTIILVDSFSYYRGSLESAAKIFCPHLPKLTRLEGLGDVRRTSKDSDFCAYAMRDAEVAYHIGRALERLHQDYDLQQSVSIADLASRIFRHQFLDYTIPQPSREIIDCALLSYHGGKNNLTVDAGWHRGVHSLDISSAYPDAMQGMPAFSSAKFYRRYAARRSKVVPEYGVYFVSGTVRKCKWPSVFSHGFKSLSGRIDRVAMQGFELNEALRSGELKPSKIRGWFYDAEKDHQAPALRGFCDDFYAKKEAETDPVMRMMYKFILNSISGKFIQTRKRGTCAYTDIDANVTVTASDLVAGGMFHPFIASAITAHTRARIHGFEHQYEALHTATDGIFTATQARLPGNDKSLGSLSHEASGELLIIRNKCYILYGAEGPKTQRSQAYPGKHIVKAALHGFQGSVFDLERMAKTGERNYSVNRPHRLREALKRGLTPNEFQRREYTLKVPPITA